MVGTAEDPKRLPRECPPQARVTRPGVPAGGSRYGCCLMPVPSLWPPAEPRRALRSHGLRARAAAVMTVPARGRPPEPSAAPWSARHAAAVMAVLARGATPRSPPLRRGRRAERQRQGGAGPGGDPPEPPAVPRSARHAAAVMDDGLIGKGWWETVAQVEIGRGKIGRQGYGLDEIGIVPSRRTRDPEEVSIAWQIDAYRFGLPLVACPMDSVVSPATAIQIGQLGGLAVLDLEGLWTRYEDPGAAARGGGVTRRRGRHQEVAADLRAAHQGGSDRPQDRGDPRLGCYHGRAAVAAAHGAVSQGRHRRRRATYS